MPPRRRPPCGSASTASPPGSLVALALGYGVDPAPAADLVERACAASDVVAERRRWLLARLRGDLRLGAPPLGPLDRLIVPPPDADGTPHPLATLADDERSVLVGALLDGLDATALAHATGSTRTTIKAAARRLLAKLDGNRAGDQTLASIASMMAGEYALGLLHPDGQRLFERGLVLDATLRAEVARWDAVLAALPVPTAPSAEPQAVAAEGPAAMPRRAGGRWWLVAGGLALAAVAALLWPSSMGAPPLPTPRTAPLAAVERVAPLTPEVPRLLAAGLGLDRAAVAAVPERQPVGAGIRTFASDVVAADGAASGDLPPPEVVPSPPAAPPLAADVSLTLIAAAGAAVRAEEMADRLAAAGIDVRGIVPVAFTVSADRLRYFHDGDGSAAGAVRERLQGVAGAVELQDFTHYAPRPPQGTLELWLSDRSR